MHVQFTILLKTFAHEWVCVIAQLSWKAQHYQLNVQNNMKEMVLIGSSTYFLQPLYLMFEIQHQCHIFHEMQWIDCFCGMVDQQKVFNLFPVGTIVREILNIVNLCHTSEIWTCTKPEFRLWWMKLCSSDKHYTPVPL